MNARIPLNEQMTQEVGLLAWGKGRSIFMRGLGEIEDLTGFEIMALLQETSGKAAGAMAVTLGESDIAKIDGLASKYGVSRNKIGRVIVRLGLDYKPVNAYVGRLMVAMANSNPSMAR